MLKEDAGDLYRLYYFDHEQSCGWQNDPSTGGKIRINSPERELGDAVGRYVNFAREFGIRETSSLEERANVFHEIELTAELLKLAQAMLPAGWVTNDQYGAIADGLVPWWKFLRASPYEKVDAVIFR